MIFEKKNRFFSNAILKQKCQKKKKFRNEKTNCFSQSLSHQDFPYESARRPYFQVLFSTFF